jgi:hypothetical protein
MPMPVGLGQVGDSGDIIVRNLQDAPLQGAFFALLVSQSWDAVPFDVKKR